jgi:ABC-2 type transport system ATP-binding protein
MNTPRPPAIEAAGIHKSFGSRPALRGVDLRVEPGQIGAVLGPNGAGKTTLVRILATLLEADAGTARVGGHDVRTDRRAVRRLISLTGQFAALDDVLTGEENLTMLARLAGLRSAAAAGRSRELLEQFDLTAAGARRVATYSGGMRRRLDLAAGLVGRPAVVFLDEPTTGLDPASRRMLWATVRELAAAGVGILLTTQYLDEADELADRITVIDDGAVVAEGTAGELKARVRGRRLDLLLADDDSFAAAAQWFAGAAVHVDRALRTVGLPSTGAPADVRQVLDACLAHDITVERLDFSDTTLDEVFLALVGRAGAVAPAGGEPQLASMAVAR